MVEVFDEPNLFSLDLGERDGVAGVWFHEATGDYYDSSTFIPWDTWDRAVNSVRQARARPGKSPDCLQAHEDIARERFGPR